MLLNNLLWPAMMSIVLLWHLEILERLSVGKTSYCIIYCSSDAGMFDYREVTRKVVRGRVNAANNNVAWELSSLYGDKFDQFLKQM